MGKAGPFVSRCLFAAILLLCANSIVPIAWCQNSVIAPSSAQPVASNTAGASAGATAAQSADPTKKVWTNDDLNDLHATTPQAPNSGTPKRPAARSAKSPAQKTTSAAYYQQQIARLQAQIPAIDSQIAELQAALSGKPVEEPRKYGWQRPDDWQTQLTDLQKKRADLEAQIQALEDQARHNGVPASAIP